MIPPWSIGEYGYLFTASHVFFIDTSKEWGQRDKRLLVDSSKHSECPNRPFLTPTQHRGRGVPHYCPEGVKFRLFMWSPLTLQDESPSSPPGFSDTHSSIWWGYLISAWWKSRLPTGPLMVGKGAQFYLWCFARVKQLLSKNFVLVACFSPRPSFY